MHATQVIRISVLAAAAGALAGCVTPPDLSNMDLACQVTPNTKQHQITYGVKNDKSILEVKEKVEVKQKTPLVFKLKPHGVNASGVSFDDVDVTVVGKKPVDKVWFTAKTGKGNDSLLAVCAPSVTADTTYEYEVYVAGFGMLDPRVDVKQ